MLMHDYGEGEGGSHNVDIILGGYTLIMILDYKGSRGVKNLGKSYHVIIPYSY